MGSAEEIANLLDLLSRGILTPEEFGQAMDQAHAVGVRAHAGPGADPQLVAPGVSGPVASGPGSVGRTATAPITLTEFPNGMLRVNLGRAEAETTVVTAAHRIGLSVSPGPGSLLLVNGKALKHNAARLSVELQDEPMGSTLLILGRATGHLGPGTGKLQREFLAALREQIPTHPSASG